MAVAVDMPSDGAELFVDESAPAINQQQGVFCSGLLR